MCYLPGLLVVPGADDGGVDWVASHPPWMWSVLHTSCLFEHSLIYLTCEQSVWWNAYQSLRENSPQTSRTWKPNSVAFFILFMVVAEHWQLHNMCKSTRIDPNQLTHPNEYLIIVNFTAHRFSHLSFYFSGSAPVVHLTLHGYYIKSTRSVASFQGLPKNQGIPLLQDCLHTFHTTSGAGST